MLATFLIIHFCSDASGEMSLALEAQIRVESKAQIRMDDELAWLLKEIDAGMRVQAEELGKYLQVASADSKYFPPKATAAPTKTPAVDAAHDPHRGFVRRVACNEQTLKLKCDNGTRIALKYWNFGRTSENTCPVPKEDRHPQFSTSCKSQNNIKIKEACEGKPECSVLVLPQAFKDDPCYGTPKYVEVEFECQESGHHRIVACEPTSAKLHCKPGSTINITYANWGRTERSICPVEDKTLVDTTSCRSEHSHLVRVLYAYMRICVPASGRVRFLACPAASPLQWLSLGAKMAFVQRTVHAL